MTLDSLGPSWNNLSEEFVDFQGDWSIPLQHLVLILVLIAWQARPAGVLAQCEGTPDAAQSCCGGECCCPPTMCGCHESDESTPAIPSTEISTRTLELALSPTPLQLALRQRDFKAQSFNFQTERADTGKRRIQALLCRWVT